MKPYQLVRICGRGFNSGNGIELAADYLNTVDANEQLELVGLRASRAGFRTFPQELEAVVRC